MLLDFITQLVFDVGLTLGVGSSTFALLFYIMALTDGEVDPSERRFMHAVYKVLRIGMFLIAFALILSLFTTLDITFQYISQWSLLLIITLNALGMTFKVMPMKYGPVITGGSWYSLFLVSILPGNVINPAPISFVLTGYLAVLCILYFTLNYFKKKYHPPHHT